MKILSILFFIVGVAIADESAINNNANVDSDVSIVNQDTNTLNISDDNNVAISNSNKLAQDSEQNIETNPDEQLKNDIITFDRVDYIKENASISDPFIYVYPQSEEDLASILQTEQATLVLNGVVEDKASINNTWVAKNDIIEGWTVSDIQLDKVELKFRTMTKVLHVYPDSNVKIK